MTDPLDDLLQGSAPPVTRRSAPLEQQLQALAQPASLTAARQLAAEAAERPRRGARRPLARNPALLRRAAAGPRGGDAPGAPAGPGESPR
ncbi:hypothetical protein [Modestobacter sp. SYSU DS0657]